MPEPVMMSNLIKHSFEKFAWMFIAKDHGHPEKIVAYLESIEHLIADIC